MTLGAITRTSYKLAAFAAVVSTSILATPAAVMADVNAGGNSRILTEVIPRISGPKHVVSVGSFTSIGAFSAKYGSWDIGGGLAAMLTSALVESGRFIVLERAQLKQVLTEQELKGNRLMSRGTGPKLGRLTGAQFLIYGAVTEFGADDNGGGFSIGGAGGFGGLLSGALSTSSASGSVSMDIRIVDTTSGRVVQTHRVSAPIESSGFDLSFGYRGISLGGNQFKKTPLGLAVRNAITGAVQLMAIHAQKAVWSGQVVDVDGSEIFINAGASSGLKKDDLFMVERVVKRLTDPTTGEVLMIRKRELGVVQLTMVTEKIASGTFRPLDRLAPRRGDSIVIIKRGNEMTRLSSRNTL
jgi:curli biogenesis system outer membrane secretion channel CsgG